MKLISDKKFEKQYGKLPKKIQERFIQRVHTLTSEISTPSLRVHTLKGDKYPLQSMNVTGDYRALFIIKGKTITFYEIGAHSELYGK